MERLNDYGEFRALYTQYKNRFGKLESNCPFPARTLARAIEDGETFLQPCPEGLLVLTRERDWLQTYYFVDPKQRFPQICARRDLLIEIPLQQREEDSCRALKARLAEAGFSFVADNLQVTADLTSAPDALREKAAERERALAAAGLVILPEAGAAEAEDVMALWGEHLKPTDVPASHLSFAEDAAQHTICVLNGDGDVVGVHWWSVSGTAGEVRHTVTHPDWYRNGIGSCMIARSLADAAATGCRSAYTFIDEENARSLSMYAKLGFAPNGRHSLQFLKPKTT